MTEKRIPRYIVWSTDHVDLSDEWQRKWYIRQVLMHGRAEDVARLDWDEIERLLSELDLPPRPASAMGDLLPCSKSLRNRTGY